MPDPAPDPNETVAPKDAPLRPPRAPVTRPRRRFFSPVWIIPLVAAALGLWLVVKYYSAKGPEIEVSFETADGIIAGKTPVLCRSVNVGTVGAIRLSEDLKQVLVTLDMTHDATRLLNKDTQIWVVRARYGAAGISGLSTLVSGNYIELQPGVSQDPRREYVGLENPPVTPPGVPGLHMRLVAEEAGGLGPGSSIIYKGIDVGKIEARTFHPDTGDVEFSAFISGEYANLVNKDTHFWNYSGIDLKVGPDGVSLHTGTLTSILTGGVTFSEPTGKHGNTAHVADGTTFTLYASYGDAMKKTELNPSMPYLLLFTGSVRGLSADAPVEFRGIQVGTVSGISFKYLPNDPERRVPVLVKIDPSAFVNVPASEYDAAVAAISGTVDKGMRASLKTGSLLTGQLYVDLDFQKDFTPEKVTDIEGYAVLPTVSSGLGELQEKVNAFLDKLQALPLDKTVQNANDTLASLNSLLSSKETQALPEELRKDLVDLQKTLAGYNGQSSFYTNLSTVLQQLNDTLRSLKSLSGTLERNPNSIIFGKPSDVAPPKGSH